MNIIIVGDGKMGAAIATQLSAEGHDVTIIDSNPQALSNSADQMDIMTVIGNGASMATLKTAGVERADLLIAATSRDELNLLTCLTAKKLGLSMTVNPEQAAAQEAYRMLQFPSFLKRESFAKGRVEIVSIPVGKDSKLVGIPLFKLYEIAGVNVLVCAVERDNAVHIPSGSFTLREGDTIFVTAGIRDLAQLVKNLGLVEKRIRSLFIIGGSRIAFYLAKRCIDSGISVKIVEQNHKRCLELAEAIPKATVIEADGSREDILNAEGLKSYDAAITLTGMDEENLVLSMLARHLGVSKVITKINRLEYSEMFRRVGIGSVISPKGLCCANIVRYVRAMSTASDIESMLTLHTIVDGQVEALEFQAGEGTRHRGEALKDIPLKEGILISCITHEGQTIIPRGDSSFASGDTVIVVTAGGRAISDLDDIFAD